MVKRILLESRWQAILDNTCDPSPAGPPAAAAAERRDLAARHALLHRIHSEFEEMPGLSLTLGQAVRLFGVPRDVVSRILEGLTAARVLCQRRDGRFVLRTTET